MSLILRKATQEILDANDLGMLHTDIDDGSHVLSLVTECGKPIVRISGIRFSRMAPTGKEIEYAVELFDSFLVKHGDSLREYIKHARADKLEEDAPLPHADDFGEDNVRAWGYVVQVTIDDIELTSGDTQTIRLCCDENSYGLEFYGSQRYSVADLTDLSKVIKTHEKKLRAMQKEQQHRTDLLNQRTQMLASLSICDI